MLNKQFSNEIDELQKAYNQGGVQIEEGLYFSQKETLKKVFYYSTSNYLTGNKDRQGRKKPFYNIVNQVVDTESRATDFDVKNIQIRAETNFARAMLLRRELVQWLKEHNFGKTLNELNECRVRYGTVVAKKTEYDKDLCIDLVPLNLIVTDQLDMEGGTKIEKHFMSQQELRAKADVWDNIDDAIKLASKVDENNKEIATSKRIEVLEIEGEFPRSYFDDGDDDDYARYTAIVATGKGKKVLLFSKELKPDETKYKITHRRKLSGRGLGQGAVEDGFEAQQWVNEAAIQEKVTMELAGKVIVKTTAKNVGNNLLTSTDDGKIINIEPDDIFEQVNLSPSALPEFQNMIDRWQVQYQRVTSTFESVTGETQPSGTPFAAQALQSAQASSIHDYRRENFGFFVKELIEDWVLPYLIKRITKEHVLETEFTPAELRNLDLSFAAWHVNQKLFQALVSGEGMYSDDYEALINSHVEELQRAGKTRRIQIPDDYFKDVLNDITVITTNENVDKDTEYQTLFSLWNMLPPEDPNRQMLMDRIVELSGTLSPASFAQSVNPPQQAPSVGQAQPSPMGPQPQSKINSSLPQAQQ